MIHAENQVRNFYVFTKGYDASTPIDAKPEWCAKGLITFDRNKFGIQFKDANGQKLTSDLIDRKKIKEIRISVPTGFQGLKYDLSTLIDTNYMKDSAGTSMSSASVSYADGDVIEINFDFTNVFGFSDKEHYHRFFQTSYSTSTTDTADKVYKMLEAGKDAHADSIFWSAFDLTNNGGTYTLKDAKQEYSAIRGFYPHDMKIMISASVVKNDVVYSNMLNAWDISRFAALLPAGITKDTDNTMTNYFKIADLQYAQSKVRADLYGYNGYPDINPTELAPVDPEKTYVVCDIKYSRNLAGINIQDSDKELSFAMEFDSEDTTDYGRLSDMLAIMDAVSTGDASTVGADLTSKGYSILTLV